jgi:hypothetical protein
MDQASMVQAMTKVYSLPKGKGVKRSGTARENAEHAAGYSSSGESQYTRIVSRGHASPMMAHRETRGKRGQGRPLPELVRETAGALAYMQAQLRVAESGAFREKLLKNIPIKTRFLAKLREQLEAGHD